MGCTKVKNKWYAIKHKPGPKSNWVGPSLVTIEGDTVYWGSGPSHMFVHDWDEEVQIIKDYGEVDSQDYDKEDEIYNQFRLDFPPEAELKLRGGWLAPDGKFYPCRYMEHLNHADDLAFVHYKEEGDGEQRIEKEGWAKIYGDGVCLLPSSYKGDKGGEYTQAQLDTLSDLMILAIKDEDETYAEHIRKVIEKATR